MVVARRAARVRHRSRAQQAWKVLIALVAGFAVAAAPAEATPSIQAKKAEAARISNEITQAESRLEHKIEAYNSVHDDLLKTRASLRRNQQVLDVATANLAQARAQLAASLTQSYKTSGQDVLSYLLASHSFSDLIDHVQLLQQATGANGDLVRTVAGYQVQIAHARAALEKEKTKLQAEQATLRNEKQRIQTGIDALQAREAHISADIRRLIEAQQRREDAAARAAAVASTSASASGGDVAVPPSGTLGGQAVAIAMQYLGTPYVWGGSTPAGFDCSGFTMYVWAQLGVSLPHNAAAQYGMGVAVPMSDLEPGDLVFFDGLGHVGIYVGNGAFIHSPHTGDVVKISSLSGYYSANYVGARRVG
jgi:peptidoglycan DL-endopeptidase CwlO